MVADGIKLRQDINEFFTINVQPNGFGAGIEQLIGLLELGQDTFTTMADRQIRDGIISLIRLQQSDQRITRTPAETVVGVSGILIDKDPADPTKIYFRVNFNTADGRQFSIGNTVNI